MPIPVKHFYMVRHGQTEANKARIMAGIIDSPLTNLGRSQARSLHKIIQSLTIKPKIIAHSHLSRARDTANIINESLNLPIIEDKNLGEINAGDWEGVPYDDCPDLLNDHVDPPNGETFDIFSARITIAKNRLFERKQAPALIVSHGGVFKAFARIYGAQPPLTPNCTLYEFIPSVSKQAFPWEIWCYEYSSTDNETITRKSISWPSHSADKIA